MLFWVICIGEIICTSIRHNLVSEYNDSNIVLCSHIALSTYNKTTPDYLEKKIVSTLVLIRGHTALVFSALFRSFIGTPSFYSSFNMVLILPLDLNKIKIHS